MLVNIFGKRGAGKTHMIKNAVNDCEAPVVIVDILGNFTEDDIPDSKQTDSIADALEMIRHYNYYSGASDDERGLMEEAAPVIILQPQNADDAIEYISSMLLEEEGGTLVIDEADAFEMSKDSSFNYLIRYGRNFGVHVLTGCRRPAELNRNITAGANCIYIFQTQEPRDIEYFSKTILGKDQAERLKNLPAHHGLYINYDKKVSGLFKTDAEGSVWILSEKNLS